MTFTALVLPLLMVLLGPSSVSLGRATPGDPGFAPSLPARHVVLAGERTGDPGIRPAGHAVTAPATGGSTSRSRPGTPILAPEAGTVSFAGRVGGELFVTIDHGGGLSSTYSWISAAAVRKGDVVSRGQTIGATGTGHPGASVPHLHFGVKLDGEYVDPLELLAPLGVQDLIRLVPIAT